MKEKKNTIIKYSITIALILIVALLIYVSLNTVLPGMIDVIATGDNQAIENYLKEFSSLKSYLIAFLLQFIQIITIVLPSVPIQVSCGFIFGTLKASIVCYVSYVAANAVVFLACRILKDGLDKLLPSTTAKSISSSKARQILDSKYPAFTVFLASILPIIPNGAIPYVASKTNIKFSSFMLAASTGCIPTILTVCAVGGELNQFDFLTSAIVCIPLLAITGLLFWQRKNIILLYERFALKRNAKQSNDNSDEKKD